MTLIAAALSPIRTGLRLGGDTWLFALCLTAMAAYLLVAVVLPLLMMVSLTFYDRDDHFVGLANFVTFLATPSLSTSVGHTLIIGLATTAITVSLAFLYAYGLTRTGMPAKGLFRLVALIPLLAPSVLPAVSMVYLFGNQGVLRELMMGASIYGVGGIIGGEVFFTFPHALMILTVALSTADARHYEAAESLGAGPVRRFLTITLPAARYGLISAVFVVFTLTITDFGVPKVIGGQYNVLATDIYKQVVGQQNLGLGAVVGLALLLPAVLAFHVDSVVARRQAALLSSRAVLYQPRRQPWLDGLAVAGCLLAAVPLLAILGMSVYASLVSFWPYNLTLTFANYDFQRYDASGWAAYANSLALAGWTALAGTATVFFGAWLMEKSRGWETLKSAVRLMVFVPLAVPGMVLGLSYILFFNHPDNPLNFLYHTLAILVLSTVVHYYTVTHLTATTALKQLDAEFESVSMSLKVPALVTLWRVTLPLCLPAILDIATYFFSMAMTTTSAAVFLYATDTRPAAVAILNMDEAGEEAGAAAMAVMIVLTLLVARGVRAALTAASQRMTKGRYRAVA